MAIKFESQSSPKLPYIKGLIASQCLYWEVELSGRKLDHWNCALEETIENLSPPPPPGVSWGKPASPLTGLSHELLLYHNEPRVLESIMDQNL